MGLTRNEACKRKFSSLQPPLLHKKGKMIMAAKTSSSTNLHKFEHASKDVKQDHTITHTNAHKPTYANRSPTRFCHHDHPELTNFVPKGVGHDNSILYMSCIRCVISQIQKVKSVFSGGLRHPLLQRTLGEAECELSLQFRENCPQLKINKITSFSISLTQASEEECR